MYIIHIQNNMVRSRLFYTLLVQHHCVTSSVLMDDINFPVLERKAFIYTRSDVKSIFQKSYPQHCRPGTNQDVEPGLKTIYHIRRIWVIHWRLCKLHGSSLARSKPRSPIMALKIQLPKLPSSFEDTSCFTRSTYCCRTFEHIRDSTTA